MAGFFKLQKEWLENGLTWAEAGVLSDILSWNGKDGKGCSLQERADRCFLTKEGVRKVILKLNERGYLPSTMLTKNVNYVDTPPSTMLTKSANRVDDFKEKKEKIPPHPPIKKKKNYEEQKNITLNKLSVSDAVAPTAKKNEQSQYDLFGNTEGKKEKKEKVKIYSLQYRCQKIFEQEFRQYKGCNYDYTGVDAGNLKMLLRRLKKALTDKNGTEPTEDEQEIFFKDFIMALIKFKPDKFVDDKFTLQNINSQFNVIYPKLINGNNGNNNNGSNRKPTVSASFIEKHMRRAGLIVQPSGDK